jgi:hypothetical protein
LIALSLLVSNVVDISSGEEPARQKVSTLEAPEDPSTTVNALINLQDPTPKALDNPVTPVDASVIL